jgi:serine/threonine-protein kinase
LLPGGPAGSGAGRAPSALALHGTLGEGGMGVVRLGTQLRLGREVAVKELRENRRGELPALKMLQEAWVAGALEHPNIVPVYDIELDDGDSPQIVMRRIQGTPWSELLRDADAVRAREGGGELLDWNLRVLLQVCNALRFAHSRGIVHLDVKPQNVMLGPYGEVYLLDWGLACALVDDGSGRLPLAASVDEVIGTPAYLAPEMLARDGTLLSERTDVYLLGAVLYELLEGRPPHRGDTPLAVLYAAATGEPDPPDDAPEELLAVCHRAMEREPARRFASVEEFARAVQGFLQHRGAQRLVEEAHKGLGRMESMLSVELVEKQGESAVARRREVDELFAEARFGFRQALEQWPESEAARSGLRRALLLRTRFELREGDVAAAEALLRQVEHPPAELRAALVEAQNRAEADRARVAQLERMHRDQDPKYGGRTRTMAAVGLGSIWSLLPLSALGRQPTFAELIVIPLVMLAGALGFFAWARQSMGASRINRTVVAVVLMVLLAEPAFVAASARLGLRPQDAWVLTMALWSVVAVQFVLTTSGRMWPIAVGYPLAFAGAVAFPEFRIGFAAAANAILAITAWFAWSPKDMLLGGTYDGDARLLPKRGWGEPPP